MGTQADEGAAYDNPLIPNARLRQIYLSMAQVRTLALALPSAARAEAGCRNTGAGGCVGERDGRSWRGRYGE
jgi:hypothetical protein